MGAFYGLFNVTRRFNFWTDPGPLQLSGSRPHLGFFLRALSRAQSLPAVVVLRVTAQGTAP